jgi:copper chaperone
MIESASIKVTGMKCGGCETTIKNTLETLDGVLSVNASSRNNIVDVEFDTDKIGLDDIEASITKAGFKVT